MTQALLIVSGVWKWVLRLGGPGLIVVGLVDNSLIPIPGGMDFFVIILTARNRSYWWYYGFMAVIGAVVGGYVTYRLAQKSGKAEFEKKMGKKRAEKVYKRFEKGASSSIVIGSVLPPPFPLVPVLMAAGILQYSRKKFLAALTIGRAVRFFAVAYLGHVYGTAIVGWLNRYYKPLLYTFIGLSVAGGIGALVYFKWYRPQHQQHAPVHG